MADIPMIPFNKPYMTAKELHYIAEAHAAGHLSGDGRFTKLCNRWIVEATGCHGALLTHSCTAALEMAALMLNIRPGDEVIMPSYTFVSTANPFVLRNAVPVFVDIRPDTLNLDERLVEAAVTPRTRAIVPVHYAGVGCEMDALLDIAARHKRAVVEDAAQGVLSTYKGKALGSLGDIGAFSFHETKNLISGEGGACLVNTPAYMNRAEIVREKGTDRSRFFRGDVDKYTWQDVGSSYLPSEIIAAFLWAQLEDAHKITTKRLAAWGRYHDALADLESKEVIRRPIVPNHCTHNAHMFYVLLAPHLDRSDLLNALKRAGVHAVFHYVPLHDSPAGKKYGRSHGTLQRTADLSARLIRLPLWNDITREQQERVISALWDFSSKG